MANALGEAKLPLGADAPGTLKGRVVKLKVTVRAMALVEDELGCDFGDLEKNIKGTRQLAAFIRLLAEAAGETFTEEEKTNLRYCPIEVSEVFAAAYGSANTPAPPATTEDTASPNAPAPPAPTPT